MTSDGQNQLHEQAVTARPLRSSVRQFFEMVICLAIAVTLFRAFEVEGYMISTGSMAPSLLGYHKRIECPSCHFTFQLGVAFDDSVSDSAVAGSVSGLPDQHHLAGCPNCGQQGIDVARVPRNQGDQLLVHKHAYLFSRPQRWQPAVFRNPQHPFQVYVKRIAGLPGELIQIRDGDVWVNGELQRKSLESQRAIRIPVYDHEFEPDSDADWSDRWVNQSDTSDVKWSRVGQGFRCDGAEGKSATAPVWLRYRHWLRSGGEHETAVPLDRVPSGFETAVHKLSAGVPFDIANSRLQVRFDASAHMLICRGVMRDSWRDRLLRVSDDAEFQQAIRLLADRSHEGVVTDLCSYNDPDWDGSSSPVYDLMLDCELTVESPAGQALFEMHDGIRAYTLVLDRSSSEARLMASGEELPMRTSSVPRDSWDSPIRVEFSVFDRQVLVALNGMLFFKPLRVPDQWVRTGPVKSPVRIGSWNSRVAIDRIKLFRDVFYTRGKARNGVDEPYQLADDEYFMLGDNSPVSSDSRNWPDGAVNESLLVGRPFIVHLPSRPGKVRWGDEWMHFRIPDFSRIRYIR